MRAALRTLLVVLCVVAPTRALAYAEFQAEYGDTPGVGFFDATPREPSGGNPGTTLGEQRRLAFGRALEI